MRRKGSGRWATTAPAIDLDIAEVDAAFHEIERLNGRVMGAFNRRFDPSARQLRRSIDGGEIGDVRQVIITGRDPGLPPREYIRHSRGIFRDMTIEAAFLEAIAGGEKRGPDFREAWGILRFDHQIGK
jgi:myo-inositol 2-dehydrogenase/D-chiro-inositol 1-dehydrogenase